MASDFRNLRWRRSPSLILADMHFKYGRCVLLQILNIHTLFGEDWSDSKEMATDFRNSSWRRPPSSILVSMQIQCNICVLCHILNILTKFGDDWSKSEKWLPIFETQDGGRCHF